MTTEEQLLDEIDKMMDRAVDRIFELSQQNLIDDGRVDTGTMLKTANVNRLRLDKEIVYPAEYSDIIEFGRHPGTYPPIDPLIRWVRRKLEVKDDKAARRIAFAIANSIKKRGIEGTNFMQRAINQGLQEFNLGGAI